MKLFLTVLGLVVVCNADILSTLCYGSFCVNKCNDGKCGSNECRESLSRCPILSRKLYSSTPCQIIEALAEKQAQKQSQGYGNSGSWGRGSWGSRGSWGNQGGSWGHGNQMMSHSSNDVCMDQPDYTCLMRKPGWQGFTCSYASDWCADPYWGAAAKDCCPATCGVCRQGTQYDAQQQNYSPWNWQRNWGGNSGGH